MNENPTSTLFAERRFIMKKARILSLTLAVVMLLGMIPTSSFAATTVLYDVPYIDANGHAATTSSGTVVT